MSPSRARCCAEERGRGVRAIAGEGAGQDRPVSDLTRVPDDVLQEIWDVGFGCVAGAAHSARYATS